MRKSAGALIMLAAAAAVVGFGVKVGSKAGNKVGR